MGKRLIIVLALVLAAGLCMAAYAEVQNIKVSGDIAVNAIGRDSFGLTKGSKVSVLNYDKERLFSTQTRVRVDADLTDNVSATVRLINERVWDNETVATTDIDLDLAYVTLKEFLYSPLTVTVGRQEIRWGNTLVIGNANATANTSAMTGGVPTDLSLRKAFDAVKADLNYDPLNIETFYAQIDAGQRRGTSSTPAGHGTAVYGVDASYDLGKKNTKADIYYVGANVATSIHKTQQVNTIGALVSSTPIENLSTSLEYAYQFGHSGNTSTIPSNARLSAWALEFIGNYSLPKVKFTPTLGATYAYLSGDKNYSSYSATQTTFKGWQSLYYDQAITNIAFAILPFTNVQVFSLNASAKPMEDLKVSLVWAHYRLAQRMNGATNVLLSNKYDSTGTQYLNGSTGLTMNDESRNLGYEIDATATYDYTEDVQLGLTYGYFNPGKAFSEANRVDAQQLIGSMKVSF